MISYSEALAYRTLHPTAEEDELREQMWSGSRTLGALDVAERMGISSVALQFRVRRRTGKYPPPLPNHHGGHYRWSPTTVRVWLERNRAAA